MSGLGRSLAAVACWLFLIASASATEFVIVNLDGFDEGFNDPTPVSPEGSNSGETLGEQRLIVFEAAAARWEEFLELSVELRVGADFAELDCDETSAVLGSAGPAFIDRDFPQAPNSDTWYPIALADTLRGPGDPANLGSGDQHLVSTFSSSLDAGDPDCLGGAQWYYGLDGNVPPGHVALFPVVLHELAHGLGFLTLVNHETGARLNDIDDVYMTFLRDQSSTQDWSDMTDQERADSALNDPEVVWTGPNVDVQSNFVTESSAFQGGLLRVHAPDPLEPGSSVSHWTPAADPPLLMEPSLQVGVFDQVDLTPALLQDIGWPVRDGPLIFQDRFEN